MRARLHHRQAIDEPSANIRISAVYIHLYITDHLDRSFEKMLFPLLNGLIILIFPLWTLSSYPLTASLTSIIRIFFRTMLVSQKRDPLGVSDN